MSVTVTIPVGEILRWCAIWVVVGVVLCPLLVVWGSTFVASHPKPRGWARLRGVRVSTLVSSAWAWPLFVGHALKDELRRRGVFLEAGAPPEGPTRRSWSVLTTRRRWRWVVFGSYRTTGFGSRWVAVGPVTVGVKRPRWAFVKGFER